MILNEEIHDEENLHIDRYVNTLRIFLINIDEKKICILKIVSNYSSMNLMTTCINLRHILSVS